MKIEAAKLELIEWLTSMKSEEMITALLFYKKKHESGNLGTSLTPEQKAKIYRGLDDVKAGRVSESSEVWKKYGR